jgi:diguanylate cyclase (GGDEF)-like protein/PAS domain S-box-containing protein
VALGVFARPSGSALNVATGYFVVPVLAALAIRAGVRGAAYGSAGLALLAAFFTARGRGPFAGVAASSHERIAHMQLFVVAATVMALLVAVLARRATDEARASALAEHRARAVEARFERCIAGSRVGTAIGGSDGRFLQVNESYCRIVGRSAESLVGSHFSTVTRPEDLPVDAAAMQRLLSGEDSHFEREKRYVQPDGSEVWAALTVSVVPDLEGGVDVLFIQAVDITARVDAERRLSLQATHDHLTGLANRALMLELVTRAISRLERNKKPLAVLFLDLDRFKAVNDQRGHAAGDMVLVETARRMKAAVRPSDVVARHGGDEFVVLLEAIESTEEVLQVARRLLAGVQRPIMDGGHRLDVTASVGIVISADSTDDADRLIDRADIAMYRAKQDGQGRVAVFDDASFASTLARRTIGDDLRHALARDEFLVHFQPIVDMITGEPIAFEALLRWDHPERGMLPAVDFFDQVATNVDVDALSAWVIDQAVGAIAQQHDAHHDGASFAVFVNASPQQFTDRLVTHLAEALARYDVPGGSVCVEMTESGLFEDDAHLAVIDKLRALGCRLALDDFGTGHSSMSRLATYPIDVVKIDRSFVAGFGTREVDTAIVQSVLGLAQVLGRDVIAEGVETAEQAARLVEAGCQFGQGYFFGAPAELVRPVQTTPAPG